MGAPSKSLESVALVLQQQKVTDFFDKLNDMKKLGTSCRRIRIGIMESEKPQIRGRTIRLLSNKKDLIEKVGVILNKSDIREANRLILSLVSKGLGVIEEQALDGSTRATMTPEAHKKYKADQQKPKTAENGAKKKIVYSGVTEVSKEEFHKLANVVSVALKIELEPLKQEKAEVSADKDQHAETESQAKPHLREIAAPDEETHEAPSDTESSHPAKTKEESQAEKILELQQAHVIADREKEEAERAREKAAAVVRKEIRLDEQHEEIVKDDVTASIQATSTQAASLQKKAPNPTSTVDKIEPKAASPQSVAYPADQVMQTLNPASLKPLPSSKGGKETEQSQPISKDVVSSIDDELAAIEPPPSEDP